MNDVAIERPDFHVMANYNQKQQIRKTESAGNVEKDKKGDFVGQTTWLLKELVRLQTDQQS
jgi:hypothetical protein